MSNPMGKARALGALLIVFCLGLTPSYSVVAGPGFWSGSGPTGGDIFGLTADPLTPNVFYAATRSGVFKSTDGGLSWVDSSIGINRGLGGDIEHSRTSAGVLYALSASAVFYSNNGGLAWNDRSPALAAGLFFQDISLAPTRPGRAYLVRFDHIVQRTDDAGLSWVAPGAAPLSVDLQTIQAHPANANEALAAGIDDTTNELRLFRTTDGGVTWAEMLCGGGCPWAAIGLPPSDIAYAGFAGTVYMSTGLLYRSDDFGLTWSEVVGVGGARIAVNPSNANEVFLAGRDGLVFTTDGWLGNTEELANFPGNANAVARSTTIIYNPFNPNILLAGTEVNGIYRRPAAPPVGGSAMWNPHTDGLQAQSIRAIAVENSAGMRIHAGVGDAFSPNIPSFRSIDGGATWLPAATGLNTMQFRDLRIDLNSNNVVYGAGRNISASALAGGFTDGDGGIYKSTDGGVTWATIDNGIPLTAGPPVNSAFGTVRTIALDHFSGLAGTGPVQTLYAGGSGRLRLDMGVPISDAARIYKSTDAGASWVAADNGMGIAETIDGRDVFASVVQLVQSPADATGNTLYASTFIGGCCEAGGAIPTLANGVFKTIDGGATWTLASTGLPHLAGNMAASNVNILSLALDPTDITGNTLYASTNDPLDTFLGAIYKTTDGGVTWTFSGAGLATRDVRDIIVDDSNGDVYAAAVDPLNNGDGGVFLSTDGGLSWSAVGPGFPPQAVALKLALNRSGVNPVLHAGTSRSVQSIEFLPDADTDGVSNVTESNAPNGGDGNNDAIADNIQAEVASLPGEPFNSGSLRGVERYITIAVNPISGNCSVLERVESVASINNPASLPAESGFDFPAGVVRFRIPDCSAAQLSLIFEDGVFTPDFQIHAYTPAGANDNFAWQILPQPTVNGTTWTMSLTDDGPGDATGSMDEVILFQGGPATLAEVFFRDGMEVE